MPDTPTLAGQSSTPYQDGHVWRKTYKKRHSSLANTPLAQLGLRLKRNLTAQDACWQALANIWPSR